MKLLLTKPHHLAFDNKNEMKPLKDGYKRLRVLYTAICRTDAKMWQDGHRDLVLPRVPGHEIAAIDEQTSTLYGLWPGQACGRCEFCLSGRENLCEEMKIIGFHSDGGYAEYVDLPESSLIEATADTHPPTLCFGEPVGCGFNILRNHPDLSGKNILIIGGGVLGSILALLCMRRGGRVTVVEKSAEKIHKIRPFQEVLGFTLAKRVDTSNFDVGINCCDSPTAFSELVTKIKKAGCLLFFSGLKKNLEIDTNIINLLHYKEIDLHGSYGPLKKHMRQALQFCSEEENLLALLIEKFIPPEEVAAVLPDVIAGGALKYIIDFSGRHSDSPQKSKGKPDNIVSAAILPPAITELIDAISAPGKALQGEAWKKIDDKTKPLGALGKLEEIGVQMCCIQNSLSPHINGKGMLVFAGDHGIVEEGVSAYPAKVTAQMVNNFLNGGAAINIFCRQYRIALAVVDMGVKKDLAPHPLLIDKKINYSTRNFSLDTAMTIAEAHRCIQFGAEAFDRFYKDHPCDILGVGEMGIGNTSSATAIIAAVTGHEIEDLTGRGTGIDDEGKRRKIEVLQNSLALHCPNPEDAVDILAKVGGFEIGGMCGAILRAAGLGKAVVLDGLISTSAGLLSYLLCNEVKHFLIAGHRSVEIGQQAALLHMGLEPALSLSLRLGEGTGAAMAIDMADLACGVMRDMATFDEAGITRRI